MTRVKVCGVTRLEDALLACQLGDGRKAGAYAPAVSQSVSLRDDPRRPRSTLEHRASSDCRPCRRSRMSPQDLVSTPKPFG
jgi:hypothetical protein